MTISRRARLVSWFDYRSDRTWRLITRLPFVYRFYQWCDRTQP